MKQDRVIRRMIRRDTHSSRSVPSVVVASILLVTFLWLALESVLWLLKDQPLLASPAQLRQWLLDLPANTIPAGMTAAGVGLGILGLLIIGIAVGKGRRPRRALASDRTATVVDDDVIAAAVSSKARLAAGLAPGQVTTTVGGRSVRVQVRPTSGVPLNLESIKTALDGELATYALDRPVKRNVRVLNEGAVGQ
ncbi:hypothetical protein CQ020_21555 [Arthrobacter sp. MYb23]|uniref:hypothetical protein n=1 Tax=unclassified Arthrobacter TaxID=235627 RepID=UPI000CFAE0ED|nr:MULTISPECIES: hypothetical protein [unclassified Arthrobacter]PRB37036.1 hypothetical protein CQ038_20975 [Arthrobacter sp. MYb51]PRB90208.1 hypothetical protein CQ020_21555 [Arthrobacter sp. MYb23]